jgi:hypothetical protein
MTSTFRDRPVALGVITAAAIGGGLAATGLATSADVFAPLTYVLPLSLPIGLALAWRHARPVAASPHFPVARVLLMSLQALVLGAVSVGAVGVLIGLFAGTHIPGSIWEGLGDVARVAFLGIVFMGIPMLALIGPVVTLWAMIVRRVGGARL